MVLAGDLRMPDPNATDAPLMRLIFLSGTITGGSGRSQRELANALAARGHEVRFIVDDKRPAKIQRWCYELLSDLSVRWEGRGFGDLVASLRDRFPARQHAFVKEGLRHHGTAVPQNTLHAMVDEFMPDVVVVSTVSRWRWRRVHQLCVERGIASIYYIRGDEVLDDMSDDWTPDALVANADPLVSEMERRGSACHFVPSLVDTSVTHTTSTRRVVLAINPAQTRGGDIVLQVAARLPEIPFVLQQSWPFTPEEQARLDTQLESLPNVEFRGLRDPGPDLYGDARILLVPYRVNNRPRVILEAQANGIPIIAADVPALATAVGAGGVIVPLEDIDAWVEEVRLMWSDEDRYNDLAAAALRHSERPEVDTERIVRSFESILMQIASPN